MKKINLALFIILFAFVCHAQKDTTMNRDTSTLTLPHFNLYSFNQPKNLNNTLIPHFSFEIRKMSPQFDLFYDSLYIRQVLFNDFPYSDYNKYYDHSMNGYINNPIAPYGNFESAVLCGSINYLIFLLEKK